MSGARSNVRIRPIAAGSGRLRPCSQFCSVRTSRPRNSACSRCDSPRRARIPAISTAPFETGSGWRNSTLIYASSLASTCRFSVLATAQTAQPKSANLLIASCACFKVSPAAKRRRATDTPLSSAPVRCNMTTTDALEDNGGRDTSRTGPRRASRAFNSELAAIKLHLCPIDRFARHSRAEGICAAARNMQAPQTAILPASSTSASTSMTWTPSVNFTNTVSVPAKSYPRVRHTTAVLRQGKR
jgi:hypothetical protein